MKKCCHSCYPDSGKYLNFKCFHKFWAVTKLTFCYMWKWNFISLGSRLDDVTDQSLVLAPKHCLLFGSIFLIILWSQSKNKVLGKLCLFQIEKCAEQQIWIDHLSRFQSHNTATSDGSMQKLEVIPGMNLNLSQQKFAAKVVTNEKQCQKQCRDLHWMG